MSNLQKIWELYNDYVNQSLMFDDPVDEILGFDEWAEAHHGTARHEADEFLQGVAA